MNMQRNVLKAVFFLIILIGSFITISPLTICAQSGKTTVNSADGDLDNGKELFVKARNMFYSSEIKISEVESVLTASKESFSKMVDSDLKYYWLGQVEYIIAEINEFFGKKKAAALSFNESSRLAQKAIAANENFSEAYRLLADTYMRLISYNGPLYTMSKGMEAQKLLNKAIKLDANNYTAFNSLGMYYLSAPKIGGGDVDKGIATLQKALAGNESFDKFISYVWLGIAYQKKQNKAEALAFFHKAQEIYPHNQWVSRLAESLK